MWCVVNGARDGRVECESVRGDGKKCVVLREEWWAMGEGWWMTSEGWWGVVVISEGWWATSERGG